MAATYNMNARHSSRNHFVDPPSILSRLVATLPAVIASRVHHLVDIQPYATQPLRNLGWRRRIGFRTILTLTNALIFIWVIALLWGERWIFNKHINACNWGNWERWPATATPHHLIFLADPQLIDLHTYPGRPWPLSSFTIWHTDNYLYRSYYRLQQNLHPDTLFFLGDLFDGGREWGTRQSKNEDSTMIQEKRPAQEKSHVKAWKSYGDAYWLKEYNRFGKIFFKYWNIGGDQPGSGQRGRKVIATLPGNHDLGFGENIQLPIRNRFNAYFGEGNRVDVIGNHSFVSIDSVSLSAGARNKEISGPVETFLSEVQESKRKAISRELRYQRKESTELISRPHVVEDLITANFTSRTSLHDENADYSDFPTILLTHVPLYRKSGEPCGPLREKYPPTPHPRNTPPVNPDERNALSITAGFQYQNVLQEQDSIRLISTIGNVISAFSGDDHDYCEVIHQADKNNVKEITVKSMSYAMGVRKPGFLMMSMWNPVDSEGHALDTSGNGHLAPKTRSSTATIQTHLCLLPDQLDILIHYAILIGISVTLLIIKAILHHIFNINLFHPSKAESSLLPISNKDTYQPETNSPSQSSTSSTSTNENNGLAVRSTRAKSISPGYGILAQNIDYSVPPPTNSIWRNQELQEDKNGYDGYSNGKTRSYSIGGGGSRALRDMWEGVWRVTWVVLLMFLGLAWLG